MCYSVCGHHKLCVILCVDTISRVCYSVCGHHKLKIVFGFTRFGHHLIVNGFSIILLSVLLLIWTLILLQI